MPSDVLGDAARRAVAKRAEAFSASLAITAEQLSSQLENHRRSGDGAVGAASALGRFADGRIDAARFATLSAPDRPPAESWMDGASKALTALSSLRERGESLFSVRIPPGADLVQVVESSLADAGRAFAAARLVAAPPPAEGDGVDRNAVPERFPFRLWSQAERAIAPPLVIEVAGADLSAAGLASYLDGSQCFVLVTDGPAPAAPLARLLSPGVFALQTCDPEHLTIPPEWKGPAVLALLGEGAAEFRHLPSGAGFSGLEIQSLPDGPAVLPCGQVSTSQQNEDLSLLELLAASNGLAGRPTAAGQTAAADPETAGAHDKTSEAPPEQSLDPIDALASWLLANADLEDI